MGLTCESEGDALMARKVINVCDVCGADSKLQEFEVKSLETGKKKRTELCTTHARPLAALFKEEDGA